MHVRWHEGDGQLEVAVGALLRDGRGGGGSRWEWGCP